MKNESISIQTDEEVKEKIKKIADDLNIPSNTFYAHPILYGISYFKQV